MATRNSTKLKTENVALFNLRENVRAWSGRQFLAGADRDALTELDTITDSPNFDSTEQLLKDYTAAEFRMVAYQLRQAKNPDPEGEVFAEHLEWTAKYLESRAEHLEASK